MVCSNLDDIDIECRSETELAVQIPHIAHFQYGGTEYLQ